MARMLRPYLFYYYQTRSIMEQLCRKSLLIVILVVCLFPRATHNWSMPIGITPDPTYTTGTMRLVNSNWGNTSPSNFLVNFQTTMSTSSLNASLGVMGIHYYIKGSQWGWRMTIASVTASSMNVLLNVKDSNNPIYYLRICYLATYSTLLDVNYVSYSFSGSYSVANYSMGLDDCFIQCRWYTRNQSYKTKTNGNVIVTLAGFDVSDVGYSANSSTYFGLTIQASGNSGTTGLFSVNVTVYGPAQLTFVSYFYLAYDPSVVDIANYRKADASRQAIGCFYSINTCNPVPPATLSPGANYSYTTSKQYVMDYNENNYFTGLYRMIMTWAGDSSTTGQFNLTSVYQNSDSSIAAGFKFTGNPNLQFNAAYSYFILHTFHCPTTPPDLYAVYGNNMCDNACNSSIQQYANATNYCRPCGALCWTCVTTDTTCTGCYSSQNRVLVGNQCVCDTNGGFYDDGSSNTCPSCHYSCKTCSGGTSASCLTCNTAAFRDQAVNSCPCKIGYYDWGAAVCLACHYTCSSATCSVNTNVGCTSCNLAKQRQMLANFTCGCVAGYFDNSTNNEQCQQCHYSCQTCWGSNTLCLTCSSAERRSLSTTGNQCKCNPGYYDPGSPNCLSCHVTCLTCSGPLANNCLSCDSSQGRTLSTSTCPCGVKLYDLNNVCVSCAYSCLTCNAGTAANCLTCNSAALRTFSAATNSCPCNPGYYDSGFQYCATCAPSCLTCTSSPTMCTSCHNNPGRYFTGSGYSCLCSSGYVDITSNGYCTLCAYSCLTCSGSLATDCVLCPATRIQSGTSCLCPPGTYDNGISSTCLACAGTCQTCSNGMANSCTACFPTQYRFLSPSPVGACLCSPSYYDSGSNVCQLCSPLCLTCWGSATNCSSCDNTVNHRLITGSNTCACASGYVDVGAAICSKCVVTCLTCSVLPNNCTSCSPDRTLTSGACVCVAGKFQNLTTSLCDACAPSCATCTGTNTYCTSCPMGSFRSLVANACPCVSGYMETGSTFCQTCSYTCASCSGFANVCASCPSNSFRTYDSTTFTCPCNPGYYDNGGNSTCLACSATCVTCTLFSQCHSCNSALFRTWDSAALSCPCNSGYFDNGFATCAKCASTCQTCSGAARNCLTCPSGRVLSGTNCNCVPGTFQLTGTCSPCSLSCLTCSGTSSTCTSCPTGSFLSGVECLCSTGFYLNGNLCSACDPSCAACSVTAASCTSCPSSQGTVLIGSSCVCPSGKFLNTSAATCQICNMRCLTCSLSATNCLSCKSTLFRTWDSATFTCPCNPGYFDNGVSLCQLCVSPCLTCNGGTTLNCTSCITGYNLIGSSCTAPPICSYFLFQGSCVTTCPNTTYPTGSSCLTCINNCLTCATATACTSCLPGFLLSINTCVGSCPAGSYANTSKCLSCPTNCAQCSLYSGNLVCFSCATGFSLLNNVCSVCPTGTHVVSGVNCLPCLPPCLTCNAISTGSCLTCASPFKFYSGMCLSSCPQGFTPVSGICSPCSANCVKCQSNTCLSCATGFYLDPSGRCPASGQFFDQTGSLVQCHPNCLSCTDSSFSSCIGCSQMRGDNSGMAINGYCDCWPNAIDVGNGTCDAATFKKLQTFTQVLVTSTTSASFLSALGGAASLNFLACGSLVFYQQTYANFYFINSSAVLQTDSVLQRYGDSSISKLAQGNSRERFGRRLAAISQGYLQNSQALFLRGAPFSTLANGCRIIGGLTASIWGLILITKCVLSKLKKSGKGFKTATKVYNFFNESVLIILLMFTFNEVTLYGLASFKIALETDSSQNSVVFVLASIFIAYYVFYLVRLFIKALVDISPSTQEPIRILYSGFEPSHLDRRASRVYIPLLIARSLLFSIFLVVFSASPMIQAVSCMVVVVAWDVYSFMACPYHFYVRIFLRIHQIAFTFQILLLTACVTKPQYSRVGISIGMLILNFTQVILFTAFSIYLLLERFYKIKCLRRQPNTISPNDASSKLKNEHDSTSKLKQSDKFSKPPMIEETIENIAETDEKKMTKFNLSLLNTTFNNQSFEAINLHETNNSIPASDFPISLKRFDDQNKKEKESMRQQEVVEEIKKKKYRLKRDRQY